MSYHTELKQIRHIMDGMDNDSAAYRNLQQVAELLEERIAAQEASEERIEEERRERERSRDREATGTQGMTIDELIASLNLAKQTGISGSKYTNVTRADIFRAKVLAVKLSLL